MHTAGDGAGSSNSWVQDLASLYPHDLGHVDKLPKRTPLGNRSPVKPNGRQGVCMESMSLRYRHLWQTDAFQSAPLLFEAGCFLEPCGVSRMSFLAWRSLTITVRSLEDMRNGAQPVLKTGSRVKPVGFDSSHGNKER